MQIYKHIEDDAALGRKLRVLYPDIARELAKKPTLTDLSLIPQIIQTHYKDTDDLFNPRYIFLCAVLKLYDPDVLDGWKRNLIKGFREPFTKLYNVSPTAISNQIKYIQNYYTIYKKFKDKVDTLSYEIAEVYSKKEHDLSTIRISDPLFDGKVGRNRSK